MVIKFKKGELKRLAEIIEILKEKGLVEEALVIPESENGEYEIPDDLIINLIDQYQIDLEVDEKLSDHVSAEKSDNSDSFDERIKIPIRTKSDLKEVGKRNHLEVMLRGATTDTYAIVDVLLYGLHGMAACSVDKDGKITEVHDIRFVKQPDIRLGDLTAEELSAIKTPWRYDGKFMMRRYATLSDARDIMIEDFENNLESLKFYPSNYADNGDNIWRKSSPKSAAQEKFSGGAV